MEENLGPEQEPSRQSASASGRYAASDALKALYGFIANPGKKKCYYNFIVCFAVTPFI